MTVVHRLRQRAASFQTNAAVVSSSRVLTYEELFARVDRLANALAGMGLEKGDAFLAVLPNAGEAIECELAALDSGLVWLTLTARLTWAEIRGVVATCKPKLLVMDEAGLERVRSGARELPLDPMPRVVVTGGNGSRADGRGTLDDPMAYEALIARAGGARTHTSISDEDVARLRYTSGTTGHAKAAVLPHRVYDAILDNLLHALHPMSERDRTLHVAPLTHGSGALVYPTLFAGGTNILLEHFDAGEVLRTIERERITTMFTVPTILSRLVAAPEIASTDLRSLKSLVYGGAPMPEGQLREAVRVFGTSLLHIYGMTEAPWPITALAHGEHRLDNPRLRSVGRVTPACSVRIITEDGREAKPGAVGEIQICGRNVMNGYYEDPDATRAVLNDGWLRSGDLGKMDEAGYVFIVDRKKDVIISGGFNVYATEVETALSEHPGVLESAVIGIPHPDWGELVAAFVVPKPGAALERQDIEAFARQRLSGYKRPRRIEVVPELPKNPSGKIQKAEILARDGAQTPPDSNRR